MLLIVQVSLYTHHHMELLPADADGERAGVAGPSQVSGADVYLLFPSHRIHTHQTVNGSQRGMGGMEGGWIDSFPIVHLIEGRHCFTRTLIDLDDTFLREVFTTSATPINGI